MEPRTLTHYLACLAALHGVLTLSAVFCAAMPVPLIASKVSLPAPALAGIALLSCGCCQSTCILLCFPVTAVSARACSLPTTLHSLPGQVHRAGPAPATGRASQSADGRAQRRLQPGRARHLPHPGPCSARPAPASRSKERSMQHRACITLRSTLEPAPRMYASRSASHVCITQCNSLRIPRCACTIVQRSALSPAPRTPRAQVFSSCYGKHLLALTNTTLAIVADPPSVLAQGDAPPLHDAAPDPAARAARMRLAPPVAPRPRPVLSGHAASLTPY
jgi:hypothetical protein